MRLSNPWPAKYKVNAASPYGMRRHPITGGMKMHHGVDVAMPVGTKLVAPADGIVAHKGSGSSGGYTLIIEHAKDLFTVYYHLAKPSHLKVGEKVKTGDYIADSGNTGASTGPHLHFETRKSRKFGDTFDPMTVLGESTSSKPVSAPTAPSKLVVDGVMGKNTWTALQRHLASLGHYKGRIDGQPGPQTYRAMQAWLNEVA